MGPRPDTAVAAKRAARHALVCFRALRAPYAVGVHADHMVAVAYRVAGGLDPNGGVGYQNYPNPSSAAGNVRRSAEPVLAVQRPH